MRQGYLFALLLILLGFLGKSQSVYYPLSDSDACPSAIELYHFLQGIAGEHLLFGHHRTELDGVGWKWKAQDSLPDRSDVLLSVGDYPAIFSHDFGRGYKVHIDLIKSANEKGAIVTFSWHLPNLATGSSCYDTTGNVMTRILPGGDLNQKFCQELDSIAYVAKALSMRKDGIPIIFRPFHENTGSWFWWGAKHCSPEVYKKVFRYTVDYLQHTKGVHNLIYAYSPSKPSTNSNEHYLDRYPGDDVVDIIGFDRYGKDDFSQQLIEDCRLVVDLAEKHHKVAAITEFGISNGIENTKIHDWYIKCFLDPIMNDSLARKVTYAVTWANRPLHAWVPVPGDIHYEGFLKFYESSYTWFNRDMKKNYSKKSRR